MTKKKAENKIEKSEQELSKSFIALLDAADAGPKELVYGEADTELKFNVYPWVTWERMYEATRAAAAIIMGKHDTTSEDYNPALKEFAHKYGVLLCYTDLKLPDDLGVLWPVVNYTKIFDDVCEVVGSNKVWNLCGAIDEIVCIRKDAITNSIIWARMFGRISGLVEGLAGEFKKVDMAKFMEIFQKLPVNLNSEEFISKILAAGKELNT